MTFLNKLTLAVALLENGVFLCVGLREQAVDEYEVEVNAPCTCKAVDQPKKYAGTPPARPYEATVRFPARNKLSCQFNTVIANLQSKGSAAVVPEPKQVDEDSKGLGTLCECVWKPFALDPNHENKDEEVSWFEFRRLQSETCADYQGKSRDSCVDMYDFWMRKFHEQINYPTTKTKMEVAERLRGQETWSFQCDPGAAAEEEARDLGIQFMPPFEALERVRAKKDDPDTDPEERERLRKALGHMNQDGTMEVFAYILDEDWENDVHDCASGTEGCDKVAHLLKDASPIGGPVTKFKLKPCVSGRGTRKTSLAKIFKACRIPKLGVSLLPVLEEPPKFVEAYGKEMDKESDPELWQGVADALDDPDLGVFQLADCVYEGVVITDPAKILQFCPPDAAHVKKGKSHRYDDDGPWGDERKLEGEDPHYAAILEKDPAVPASGTVFSFMTKNCIPRNGGEPVEDSRAIELCGEPELGKQIVPVKVDIFKKGNPDAVKGSSLPC